MSHKFHGKASGKMKTEKRVKKQQDEMVSREKVTFDHKNGAALRQRRVLGQDTVAVPP